MGDGLADHVRPPVGRHDDNFGVEAADEAHQPVGHPLSQVREGDSRPIGRSGEVAGMVRDPDDADSTTTPFENGRNTGGGLVDTCADPGDPSVGQVSKRVAQRLGPEIKGVVVSKSDAVHAKELENLGGDGWGPEEERFPRVGPRPPTVRDRALEVEDEQVRFMGSGYDLVGEERVGTCHSQPLGDFATEHRVTREREFQDPST